MWKKIRGLFWVGLGYMLSPLSWWNDLFFNLPLAYLFAYGFSWLFPDSFLLLTVIGYWISNVLGILMMQFGAVEMFWDDEPREPRRDILIGLGTSTAYTIGVVALLYFHVLETPAFLASQ